MILEVPSKPGVKIKKHTEKAEKIIALERDIWK